jgi:uncharacterized protein with HEPN domain
MESKDKIYLQHILDAIHTIEKFLAGKERSAFLADQLLQAGIVRELEIIEEAAKRLSDAAKGQAPEIPWESIAGMRDKLIHDYFNVDVEAVWQTVSADLPVLKKVIARLLERP